MTDWLATLWTSPFAVKCCVAVAAIVLDSLFAIPGQYHPLSAARLLAKNIAQKVKPRDGAGRQQDIISGTLAYITLFGPMLVVVYLLMLFAEIRYFFELIVLWVAISFSAEKRLFTKIKTTLGKEKKVLSRQWLQLLVRRDTRNLSNIGIAKAAMESLLLRFVYQVVTPLVLFLLFGAIIALAYRLALVCKWEWKQPPGQTSSFHRPVEWLCSLSQFIPFVLTLLVSWMLVLPRSTDQQQRELITTSRPRIPSIELVPVLFHLVGKRLGFALGGPIDYAGQRIRLPRYGTNRQVRYSDMAAVSTMVSTLMIITALALAATVTSTAIT